MEAAWAARLCSGFDDDQEGANGDGGGAVKKAPLLHSVACPDQQVFV